MPIDGFRGHGDLANRMLSELARRPAHAYLFAGPAGVGKALLAMSLAHSLLCDRARGAKFCCRPERCPVRIAAGERSRAGGETTRCNCCASCVQIASGAHPDFTSVARAAGRTDVLIEQVRGLIAQLSLRPVRSDMRVAILDDAETLNVPAQNALLKTLEEPPGHAVIFVISNNERALLDTVRSRLRVVRFGPLAVDEITALLRESIGLDAKRAAAAARLARGSAARALTIAAGEEQPAGQLLEALRGAAKIDFVGAQALAREFFSERERAADNFELIARLLQEILCHKLIGADFSAPEELARIMSELAGTLDTTAIVEMAGAAVRARAAIDAMANSRLQAELWWMDAGRASRGEAHA